MEVMDNITSNFEVTDDRSAEWALRKIREIYAERDRLVAVCESEIAEYNAKIAEYDDRADKEAARLKLLLASYFAEVPHKVTKTQETYRLPSGTLKLKRPAPEYKRDDKLLIEGFKQFVRYKPEFQWSEFKRTLAIEGEGDDRVVICKDDGQVVPACALQVIDRAPEFVVEV